MIELIVAIAILGLAAVAIIGGLTLTVKVSDIQRKEANAAAAVRNYAEAIETAVAGGGYKSGTASYNSFVVGSGYTATMTAKNCWTSSSTWASCTATNDTGVQRLTLQVASADGRATEQLVVVVRKPCTPGQATC